MRLPRASTLLLGFAALACSGSGSPGNDLFSDGGSSAAAGTSATQGGSSQGGSATGLEGGSASAQGGGATAGTPAGGAAQGAGGATSNGGSAQSGGGTTTSGGAPSASGGRSSNGGAQASGGASVANGGAGTAGLSSGGAPVVMGGAGGTASGGTASGGAASGGQGAGGGKAVSCEMLRTQLSNYLDSAQACQRTQMNQNPCTETVGTECGCQVPVNASNASAIDSYNSTLTQLKKQCSTGIACTAALCVNPTNATCSMSGPSSGRCVAVGANAGPG